MITGCFIVLEAVSPAAGDAAKPQYHDDVESVANFSIWPWLAVQLECPDVVHLKLKKQI